MSSCVMAFTPLLRYPGTMAEIKKDTPKTARRRQREKRTISQMVALYCAGHHDRTVRNQKAHCGEPVCVSCARVDAYVVERTERCLKMEVKTSCAGCENHCYRPEMQAEIRSIMRYAGPRMLLRHPIAAIRHMVGR